MASVQPVRETGNPSVGSHLFGANGELVELGIDVEPRELEDLLEALASLEFPVNPQLSHSAGTVKVEFPAYAGHIGEVRRVLEEAGFDASKVRVFGILEYQTANE